MAIQTVVRMPSGSMWLRIADGVVVSQQKWSETEVYSSGGGGYVHQGTGVVHAPVISSVTSEQHEFWVREPDGSEVPVRLADAGFAVREGQRVKVAWGAKQGRSRGAFLIGRNYATDDSQAFIGNWWRWARSEGLVKAPLLYRLLTTWLPLLLGLVAALVALAATLDTRAAQRLSDTILQARARPAALGQELAHDAALGAAAVEKVVSGVTSGDAAVQRRAMDVAVNALFTALAVWLATLVVFKMVGFIVFMSWWRGMRAAAVRRRVWKAFDETAVPPSPAAAATA